MTHQKGTSSLKGGEEEKNCRLCWVVMGYWGQSMGEPGGMFSSAKVWVMTWKKTIPLRREKDEQFPEGRSMVRNSGENKRNLKK